MENTLYITGAGVSSESGIPTFRGKDGFWTIGSENYTPQEMATREMYMQKPEEFLYWYYKRFIKYKNAKPNDVHFWLNDKRLITQNIDGLDAKAGNKSYIPIHGRLDKLIIFDDQNITIDPFDANWDLMDKEILLTQNEKEKKKLLLDFFKISHKTKVPDLGTSLKPYVLLFDEFYTEQYRITEAKDLMYDSDRFIFLGTSFSVGITSMAAEIAIAKGSEIVIVDPNPIKINYKKVIYKEITAKEYIKNFIN